MKQCKNRLLSLVALLLVLCLAVTGCGKKSQATEPTQAIEALLATVETPPPTQETEPPPPPEPIEPTWLVMPEDYELSCDNYFVYDVKNQSFISTSADPETTQIYPASITKLYTIYVAMQYLGLETPVTVGEEITMIDPDSTTAKLEQGDVVSVEQLIGGMLLPSGNDAAYAMAAAAGRLIKGDPNCTAQEAVDAFVEEMNVQAQILGMTGSHFANPDGIHDDNHYFSLADMAKLGALSLENPTVMQYAGTALSTQMIGDREVTWKNTNMLIRYDLQDMDPEEMDTSIDPALLKQMYCQYAIGLKTGRTTPAGCCLLSAFDLRGRQLVIGVFHCDEGEYRFTDTLHLLNQNLDLR